MTALDSPAKSCDRAVVAGVNDHPHFVRGWYDREVDPRTGIAYRACGEGAVLALRRQPGAKRLWLLLSGPAGLHGSEPIKGELCINSDRRTPLRLLLDHWVLRQADVPESASEHLEIELSCANTISADAVLGNGDGRLLGWFLAAAWQE